MSAVETKSPGTFTRGVREKFTSAARSSQGQEVFKNHLNLITLIFIYILIKYI